MTIPKLYENLDPPNHHKGSWNDPKPMWLSQPFFWNEPWVARRIHLPNLRGPREWRQVHGGKSGWISWFKPPKKTDSKKSKGPKQRVDMIWYDMIWYDRIRYDRIGYDMIWCEVMWCDVVLTKLTCKHPKKERKSGNPTNSISQKQTMKVCNFSFQGFCSILKRKILP